MWETEYSEEVKSFLVDNAGLVAELFRAIESLRFTEGLPDIGAMEIEPHYYGSSGSHVVDREKRSLP